MEGTDCVMLRQFVKRDAFPHGTLNGTRRMRRRSKMRIRIANRTKAIHGVIEGLIYLTTLECVGQESLQIYRRRLIRALRMD